MLRRFCRIPPHPYLAAGIHETVIFNIIRLGSVGTAPPGLHGAVLCQAVIYAVDFFQLQTVVSFTGNDLFSAGGKIIPVPAVVLILCIGARLIIIVIIFVRRKQPLPSGNHNAVFVTVVHIILNPSGLHGARVVKVIPVVVDLLPFFFDAFSVLVKVVQVITVAVIVAALYLQPLVCVHDSVRTYKVIVIVHPGVDSHDAAAVQISPVSVSAFAPSIVKTGSGGVVIYPVSALLGPALCHCRDAGAAKSYHRSKGKDCQTTFSHNVSPFNP